MIYATAALGGRYCRTLSGQRRPNVSVYDGTQMVVECISECFDTARACGVTLVMENHYKDGYWEYSEFAQRMEVYLPIVRQLACDCFGVQYDPSNTVVAGEDPLALLDEVLPYVRTMHASDRYLAPGVSPVLLILMTARSCSML